MAEYFVANDGDDFDNDGLSPEAPFETWGRVIDVAESGDTIRFKRGDTFAGNLPQWDYPDAFTVDAYGEGVLPVISKTGGSGGSWLMFRSGGGAVDIRIQNLRFPDLHGSLIRLGSSTVTQGRFILQDCEIEDWALGISHGLDTQCIWLLGCQFEPGWGIIQRNKIVQDDPSANINNPIRAERESYNLTVRDNEIDTDASTTHDLIQNSFAGDIRNFIVRGNDLKKRQSGSGKGVIIVQSDTANDQSCLIEDNTIDGFGNVNWAISPWMSNCTTRRNTIKGITGGSDSNPLRFVRGDGAPVTVVTGNVVEENIIDGGDIAMLFGFADAESWEGDIRRNVIRDVGQWIASQPTGDPPTTAGTVSRNIVVNSSGGRGVMSGAMDFSLNYFFNTSGETDSGGDPDLTAAGCPQNPEAWQQGPKSCPVPEGTTYFVSSSDGSDSNDGLSEGAPFATLAKFREVWSIGDVLRLKRGDSWDEGVFGTIDHSLITIDAYGDGDLPIISNTVNASLIFDVASGSGVHRFSLRNIRFENVRGRIWRARVGSHHLVENIEQHETGLDITDVTENFRTDNTEDVVFRNVKNTNHRGGGIFTSWNSQRTIMEDCDLIVDDLQNGGRFINFGGSSGGGHIARRNKLEKFGSGGSKGCIAIQLITGMQLYKNEIIGGIDYGFSCGGDEIRAWDNRFFKVGRNPEGQANPWCGALLIAPTAPERQEFDDAVQAWDNEFEDCFTAISGTSGHGSDHFMRFWAFHNTCVDTGDFVRTDTMEYAINLWRNLVVNSGFSTSFGGSATTVERDEDHYIFNSPDRSNTGPDPELDSGLCPQLEDSQSFGKLSCLTAFGQVYERRYGEGDTLGNVPADHTLRWGTPGGVYAVEAADGAANSRALVTVNPRSQTRDVITWNVIDSDQHRAHLEGLARVMVPSHPANHALMGLISGASAAEGTARRGAFITDGPSDVGHYLPGSLTFLAQSDKEVPRMTWFWVRVRFYGALYALKFWVGAENEPDEWDIVGFAPDAVENPGWAGILAWDGHLWVDRIVFATGGLVAPVPDVEPEPEPEPDPEEFGVIDDLHVIETTADSITLGWSEIPGASGYDMEMEGVVIAEDHPAPPFTVGNLPSGVTRVVRARPVKDLNS